MIIASRNGIINILRKILDFGLYIGNFIELCVVFGKVPEFYECNKMDVIKKPFRLFFVLNEAYKWR